MNIFAYIFYLLLAYFITVHVGLRFYRNGRLYILRLLHGNEMLTDFINRALLTGYYLLNLGYAAFTLRSWQTLYSLEQVFISVLFATGKILLTLGVIHFFNMAAIFFLSRYQHSFHHHKK